MTKPDRTFTVGSVVVNMYVDDQPMSPNDSDGESVFLWADTRDLNTLTRKDGRSTGAYRGISRGDLESDAYAVYPLHIGYRAESVRLMYTAPLSEMPNPSAEPYEGFLVIKRADFAGYDSNRLLEVARAYVDEWNTYLSGDVWMFNICDSTGHVYESHGNYYGFKHAEEEARSVANDWQRAVEGRLLLCRLADDAQRLVALTSDRIEIACRRATASEIGQADVDKANDAVFALDAWFNASDKSYRDGVREMAYSRFDGVVNAAMVYAQWRSRYWPGD